MAKVYLNLFTHLCRVINYIISALLAELQRKSAPNEQNCNSKAAPNKKFYHSKYSRKNEEIIKRIKNCKDHYEILIIEKCATILELQTAYRKLSLTVKRN